ncbi:MAG: hypothetical protein JNK34_14280, partial [Tabrizicola sp.]|nr:hypothetical protein [Tabrizicola sp.]
MRLGFPFLAVAALALAACATAPTYAPASGLGRPGYSEQRIESDRFRVVFRSQAAADPGLIEALALRRAAEITVETGYDHFIVDRREVDRGQRSGP